MPRCGCRVFRRGHGVAHGSARGVALGEEQAGGRVVVPAGGVAGGVLRPDVLVPCEGLSIGAHTDAASEVVVVVLDGVGDIAPGALELATVGVGKARDLAEGVGLGGASAGALLIGEGVAVAGGVLDVVTRPLES